MPAKILREKLGYKAGQSVLLLDLPAGMPDPFEGVDHTAAQSKSAKLSKKKFDLVLAFTEDQAALAAAARTLLGSVAGDDAKIWLVYPKKSGRIKTDLTRDSGWGPMFDAGYIVVSIAAVDETWSAVRFRPKHLVKSVSG